MTDQRPDETHREMIHRHQDAGTCYLCGKEVVPFTAIHGATGAHWDCSAKLSDAFENLFKEPEASGEHIEAVAKGGSIVHIIDTGNLKPLCGYVQADTAKRMKKRSGWWVYKPVAGRPTEGPHAVRHCSGCSTAFKKLQDDEL